MSNTVIKDLVPIDDNPLYTNSILVTNIQQFSLHDGPGIRTTVFLKGCSIRCPWCCNPENLNPFPENYIKEGVRGRYGKYMTCGEIFNKVIKDKGFYVADITKSGLDGLPGGVTFSGGEALLQINSLVPLLKKLSDNNIHIAVETCLFVSTPSLHAALNYVDLFYVDIKIINKEFCEKFEHGDIALFLYNLDKLLNSGKPVVFRIPVIGGYTDGEENRSEIKQIIEKYFSQYHSPLKVELIKEHNLGASKYQSLNLPVPEYRGVSNELMEVYKREIETIGVETEICRI